MASQNKIIEMIAAIKQIYPYYAKEANVQVLVKTWSVLLKDIPDDVMETAYYKALQTCKMPPTPADILENVKEMQAAFKPTNEELWDKYIEALRKGYALIQQFPYTYIDASGISQGQQARQRFENLWADLPEEIKMYIGSKGEMQRQARAWALEESFATYEKPRFMKNLPIVEKRMEYTALASEHRLFLTSGGE